MTIDQINLTGLDHSDDDGNRRYQVTYLVTTTSSTDGAVVVKNSTGLPSYGDAYSLIGDSDAGAPLLSRSVKFKNIRDDYKTWEVVDTYQTFALALKGEALAVNTPIDMPPRWSGSFVQFTRPYLVGRTTDSSTVKSIKNAAYFPFVNPPVMGDDSRMSIVVEKNLSSLSVSTWVSFRDAVNDGTFWGFSKRRLKVQSISWEKAYFKGTAYYPVRWEIHVHQSTGDPLGWDQRPLDCGTRERGGSPITFGDPPTPTTICWPLTTAGLAMASTDAGANKENYTNWRIYNEKDFGTLGIPTVLGGDT